MPTLCKMKKQNAKKKKKFYRTLCKFDFKYFLKKTVNQINLNNKQYKTRSKYLWFNFKCIKVTRKTLQFFKTKNGLNLNLFNQNISRAFYVGDTFGCAVV